jgi:shikimate kinase
MPSTFFTHGGPKMQTNGIALIGYRATGKSTVARLLATALAWECIDTDDEIQLRAGKTIAQVFTEQGEEAFRDIETAVIRENARRASCVLTLGGGAVLRAENRHLLESCLTVWLTATAATIHERLVADERSSSRRPQLTNAGGLAEIEELLAQRQPIYRLCADLVVETEGKTPREVTDELLRQIRADGS